MSATTARNWASMLKEKKAVPTVSAPAVTLPEQKAVLPAEQKPVPAEELEKQTEESPAPVKIAQPAPAAEEATKAKTPTPTPEPAPQEVKAPPAVAYTTLGPVSLPEALAKLVNAAEFRFVGVVAASSKSPKPAKSPKTTPAAAPAASALPAAAPASSSSAEAPQHHQQWSHPHHGHNSPANYFVPRNAHIHPYGGELGSVPRYYNADRQFHAEQHQQAQPYHPSYQTPYNYGNNFHAAPYNAYDNMYPSYYPGQGAPYMGSRLQANPPYYPPRDPPQQYQQQYHSQAAPQ